jgi:predicted DNA-binding transcriptional regulator YafY
MARYQQLERIIEIDRQIRDHKYPNADSLAKELETGRRVIYKDREFLLRLGAPLAFDSSHHGWYYNNTNFALPSTYVTEGELLAFFLSAEIARRHLGSQMEKALVSAVEKISTTLKARVKIELGSLADECTFASPPTRLENERTMMLLHGAMHSARRVRITYTSASKAERTERTVDPLHLYNREGDWYLIGFDHLRGEIRMFHLDRIESARALSEKFDPPPGFSAEEWIGEGFQAVHGDSIENISIHFDAYQARWIRERVLHESQRIEEQPDGDLILHLRTGGRESIKRWVMQYGSHAEVLEPEGLRQEIGAELLRCMEQYDKKKGETPKNGAG